MSTYTSEVLRGVKNNIDCKHLYDLIDFDRFLPVDGLYEWVRDNIGDSAFEMKGDNHPSSSAHKQFTDSVILPFIEDKCYGSTAGSNPAGWGSIPCFSANSERTVCGKHGVTQ